MGFCCVAQASLGFEIFLLVPPECWDFWLYDHTYLLLLLLPPTVFDKIDSMMIVLINIAFVTVEAEILVWNS